MGNHSNRNWRRRWRVDLAARTATHQTGLVVTFREHPEGGWAEQSDNINGWFAKDPMNRAQIVARLIREAGDIYKEHLDRRQ